MTIPEKKMKIISIFPVKNFFFEISKLNNKYNNLRIIVLYKFKLLPLTIPDTVKEKYNIINKKEKIYFIYKNKKENKYFFLHIKTSSRIEFIDKKNNNIVLINTDIGKRNKIKFDLIWLTKDSKNYFYNSLNNLKNQKDEYFQLVNHLKSINFIQNRNKNNNIDLFTKISIETYSKCNRRCLTCIRQNDPGKSRWWNNIEVDKLMPLDMIHNIVDQLEELKYIGEICLQFFNEPLMDNRIPEIADYIKEKGFPFVYINTNGDFLTEELAGKLDGNINYINVALYDNYSCHQDYLNKGNKLKSYFKKTKLNYYKGRHLTTHFSPLKDLHTKIKKNIIMPCPGWCQHRMIISYDGSMKLCCEDIMGKWNLGNIKNKSLYDLWFSKLHQKLVKDLSLPGGRKKYKYCTICPI